MKQFSVYLSGGMEYKNDLGVGWRQFITPVLESSGYKVFDPAAHNDSKLEGLSIAEFNALKLSNLDRYKDITRKNIIKEDYMDILQSDLMILLYDESARKGAGTLSEASLSYTVGIPILMVTSYAVESIPGWLLAEVYQHYATFDAVLSFLKEKEKVEQLLLKCKQCARKDPVVSAIKDYMANLYSEVSKNDIGTSGCGSSCTCNYAGVKTF